MVDPALPARLIETIDAHLAAGDPHPAVSASLRAVEDRELTVPELYVHVLQPLLVSLGSHWKTGELPVWREHYGTAVVRTIVDACFPHVGRMAAERERSGKSVLLACPPQESHDLGLRMLSDRFELAGWRPYFLGADVPVTEMIAAAATLHPDLLVLSAATHFNRVELRDVVDRLRRDLSDVDILATGHAFSRSREGWSAEELLDADELLGDV